MWAHHAATQDNVTQPFEDVLPYERFSVRVLEADIDRLPDILATISESKRRDMRAEAACAWRAMVWSSVHGSFTGADDDTTDAMAVLIHTLRGRLGLDGAVGSQVRVVWADAWVAGCRFVGLELQREVGGGRVGDAAGSRHRRRRRRRRRRVRR
jgi:hypothetical protein